MSRPSLNSDPLYTAFNDAYYQAILYGSEDEIERARNLIDSYVDKNYPGPKKKYTRASRYTQPGPPISALQKQNKIIAHRTKMDAASEAEWKRRMAANKKAFQDMKERKALAAQIARSKAIAKQKLAWTKHQKRFGLGRFNPNRQRQQKTKVYNVYKQKVSGLGTTTTGPNSGFMPPNFYCPTCSYPIDECDCGLSAKDKMLVDQIFRH